MTGEEIELRERLAMELDALADDVRAGRVNDYAIVIDRSDDGRLDIGGMVSPRYNELRTVWLLTQGAAELVRQIGSGQDVTDGRSLKRR